MSGVGLTFSMQGCVRSAGPSPLPSAVSATATVTQKLACAPTGSLPNSTTYAPVYSFGNPSDFVKYPNTTPVAYRGMLYGTASGGYGSVYAITTDGREQQLFAFGGTNGFEPMGDLVAYRGRLYGTTLHGGPYGEGNVFSVTANGVEKPVHRFGDIGDGAYPVGGLLVHGGLLYGTTTSGGSNGWGVVYSLTRSGTEKILYSFGSGTDGREPWAALIAVNGTLYGTTINGGKDDLGTVFSITPDGTERVLYSFRKNGDGEYPLARLLYADGSLYGTTLNGGAHGFGTLFSVGLAGKERVLHSFDGSLTGGCHPKAGLVEFGGKLYGTTYGPTSIGEKGFGTIFRVTPSGGTTTVYHFRAGSDGNTPGGGLVALNGALYGAATLGGDNDEGVLYRLSP
ncbi:MAG: choice-of-anchor tandem repeat GloVer-containing protein [Candidatus Tumulicola sp.]